MVTAIFTACSNGKKIEGWNTSLFESVGAPFLKQPKNYLEFRGPYADGKNNDGVFFSIETKNHKQSFDYLEQCVKGVLKYADAVYDLSGNGRDRSKFTIDYLQQYAVDKKNVRMKGSQWAGAYHYDLIFPKTENILNSQVVSKCITVMKELTAKSDSIRFLICNKFS